MRKLGIVVVLGLALLLGQTWSAHADAVVVNDPAITTAMDGGDQLFVVFNTFGWSSILTSNPQIGALTPIETLFAGTYYLTNEYTFSDPLNPLKHTPGWSPVSGPAGIFTQLDSLSYTAAHNGYHTDALTITQANSFCFADKVDGAPGPTRYTKWSYNSPMGFQSNGFIFLDEGYVPNATYTHHLIVVFEEADISATDNSGSCPDLDYHDLVLNIYTNDNPIPIPGTLPLLGSGLLGLAGLGWWRRRS
jgi:hypothetical protein